MGCMNFHEGQTAILTADLPIGPYAYITHGNSGYVEQTVIGKPPVPGQAPVPYGDAVKDEHTVWALVHFSMLGLKAWVPAVALDADLGS